MGSGTATTAGESKPAWRQSPWGQKCWRSTLPITSTCRETTTKVIVENGQSTTVSEREVVEEASARAADLVQKAGLGGLREPWRTQIEFG